MQIFIFNIPDCLLVSKQLFAVNQQVTFVFEPQPHHHCYNWIKKCLWAVRIGSNICLQRREICSQAKRIWKACSEKKKRLKWNRNWSKIAALPINKCWLAAYFIFPQPKQCSKNSFLFWFPAWRQQSSMTA